ncbi:MAG TPA: hypothetical protein HA346_03770 [Thermoplasmata archaeon]|nr:hypothetical protein [Thermoplasmata archaeon]
MRICVLKLLDEEFSRGKSSPHVFMKCYGALPGFSNRIGRFVIRVTASPHRKPAALAVG